MYKKLFFIFALIITIPIFSQDKKVRIVVFDFKALTEVKQSEAEIVSGLIRNELINTNRFDVVDRQNLEKVLSEKKLKQQCGVECEVDIGRFLMADKNMTGTISKLGDSYIIDAKITDLKEGKYDFGESEKSTTLDGLSNASNELVSKIIFKMSESKEPPPKKSDKLKKSEKVKQNVSNQKYNFLKSAIIPGWTQYSNGYELKGAIFFLSFVAVAGTLKSSFNHLNSSKNSYNTNSNAAFFLPDDFALISYLNSRSNYSSYSSNIRSANNISALLAGIYVLNLIDAIFWSDSLKGNSWNNQKENLQLYSSVNHTLSYNHIAIDRTLSINYTWRF